MTFVLASKHLEKFALRWVACYLFLLAVGILSSAQSPTVSLPPVQHNNPAVLLETLSWDEAEHILTPDTVVVIALGAESKEHGHHLQLNNDFPHARVPKKRNPLRRAAKHRHRSHHQLQFLSRLPRISRFHFPQYRYRSLARCSSTTFFILPRATTAHAGSMSSIRAFPRSGLSHKLPPISQRTASSSATPTSRRMILSRKNFASPAVRTPTKSKPR